MTIESRHKQIARMLEQGLSFGKIAKRLGTTRNAVAGFCHRQGLRSKNRACWGKEATIARWADPKARERHSQIMLAIMARKRQEAGA